MKKFFTFIAAAMLAAGANAQTTVVKINETGEASVPGNTVLTDNECFKATTVYTSIGELKDYKYPDENVFPAWIQLRVAAEPTETYPNGTENAESTPVVIVAKKDATFNAYVRTGNNKEVKLFDQSTFTALNSTNTFVADGSSNNLWIWTWTIEAGKTYVLTEKGGTGRLSGFSYNTETSGINEVTNSTAVDKNAPVYNLAGQRVNKDAKGVLIQNGKKFVSNK